MRALPLVLASGAVAAFLACGGDRASAPGPGPAQATSQTTETADIVMPLPVSVPPHATGHRFAGGKSSYRARVEPVRGELSVTAGMRDRITLRTTSIARGRDVLWQDGAGAKTIPLHGHVTIVRGPVRERIATERDAVEQTFSFATRPAGTGDLTIALDVHATSPLVARGDGVRAGSLSIRDATWVDARGTRTRLPIVVEGETLRLRVPGDVVDRSAYPAVLDPTIGPELSLDAPIVSVHDAYTWGPRVSFGKDGVALVFWADYRVPSDNQLLTGNQMMGARIAADGTVMDPTGLELAGERDAYFQDFSLAYDGTSKWFMTWREWPSYSNCHAIRASIIDENGKVVAFSEAPGGCSSDSVAAGFDGTHFITAFNMFGNGLYATRFSQAGAPLDTLPKMIASDARSYARPHLGCRNGGCLVAWPVSGGMRATRLGPNLAILDAPPLVLPGTAGVDVSGVAFDGQQWVVAYDTTMVRIDPTTGAVSSPVTIGGSSGIAFDGTNTWSVWPGATNQVQADRLTQAGALVAGGPLTLTSAAQVDYEAAIAFGPTHGIVAWDDGRAHTDGTTDIFFARVSKQGASLDGDGIVLNKAANAQLHPAVATTGNGFLVGWVDSRAGYGKEASYVARLSAAGALLDTVPTLIDAGGSYVDIASDKTDYLVSYVDAGPKAVRVSGATGAVLGSPIALPGTNAVHIDHDGTQYVAAWNEASAVKAAFITNAGVLGTPFTVVPSGAMYGTKSIASSDGVTAVVFGASSSQKLQATRIDKSGALLDATPIELAEDDFLDTYSVRSDGGGFTVAIEWGDIVQTDVRAVRFSSAGVVLAPKDIRVAEGGNISSQAAAVGMGDGVSTLIAWSDNRSPTRYMDYGIHGAWLRQTDGQLLDIQSVVLADSPGNELFPALAPAGPGRALLVYQANDYAPGIGNARIHARFIGSGALAGAVCTKDDDCSTRACSSGVCCDRACTGTCETCAGTNGKCTKVVDAEDPDTCAGDRVCSATSECKQKLGRSCAVAADCSAGHCADGICCESPCNASCESCAALTGKCGLRSARAAGGPSCAPYACDGQSNSCPTTCASDAACPPGSRCEKESGHCVSGASCVDRSTVARADGTLQNCAPYTCGGTECRSSCRSIDDCVAPAVCDENGTCTLPTAPPSPESGCSVESARDTRRAPSSFAGVLLLLAALSAVRRSKRRARCEGG